MVKKRLSRHNYKDQTEFAENEKQLRKQREEMMDCRLMNSLQTIRANYEGCADGVRAVMRRRDEEAEQEKYGQLPMSDDRAAL